MIKVRIWPINLSVTVTRFETMQHEFPVSTRQVVKAMAEQIFDDSQNVVPTVPVKTGALKSTGRVEKSSGGWAVVYGGQGEGRFVDYANQVHDDMRPRHYTTPGSGPKFIEVHYLRRTAESGPDWDEAFKALTTRLFGEF